MALVGAGVAWSGTVVAEIAASAVDCVFAELEPSARLTAETYRAAVSRDPAVARGFCPV